MNLQDSFLNQVRVQKNQVSVFLANGHQMRGVVTGFDSFIILLDSGGKQNMIYKHAIATIMPVKPVPFFKKELESPEGEETEQENNDE